MSTDATGSPGDTVLAPEATEARAGNCQRSGYAGRGCSPVTCPFVLKDNMQRYWSHISFQSVT